MRCSFCRGPALPCCRASAPRWSSPNLRRPTPLLCGSRCRGVQCNRGCASSSPTACGSVRGVVWFDARGCAVLFFGGKHVAKIAVRFSDGGIAVWFGARGGAARPRGSCVLFLSKKLCLTRPQAPPTKAVLMATPCSSSATCAWFCT